MVVMSTGLLKKKAPAPNTSLRHFQLQAVAVAHYSTQQCLTRDGHVQLGAVLSSGTQLAG